MGEPHTELRLVDTKGLGRNQWLEVRKGGIGSSDAAAAVTLNPYKSPLELWMEKTGRAAISGEHAGFDDPRYWGTLLEPYAAIAYQQKTDRRVRKVNAILQHPSFPSCWPTSIGKWSGVLKSRSWSARPPVSSARDCGVTACPNTCRSRSSTSSQ